MPDACWYNLTVCIGTFVECMENGSPEDMTFLNMLEWALRDWRPVYTCRNLLVHPASLEAVGRVVEMYYAPKVQEQLESPTRLPFWMRP